MTVRELRAVDAPQLYEFLRRDFPEEKRILGMRPEGFDRVVHRIYRWDARLVLGLLRLVGRPVFRFFVLEADRRLVAMTLLTFGARAGYLSTVAVDPEYRRRGYAQLLIERSRRATARRRRPYVALDVLDSNAPARALYEKLGFRPLRRASFMTLDDPRPLAAAVPAVRGLRPFRTPDAGPLAAIVRSQKPPEVESVLPTAPGDIAGSEWVGQVLASESAAWVLDDGRGPVAWIMATVSPATEAAQLSAPIVGPRADPEAARGLVATAGAWCAARRAPRLASILPEENRRGRAAMEAAGFHDAIATWTLYRPAA